MAATTTFTRPDSWPSGLIAEWSLKCPGCGSSNDVEVQITTYVTITEMGSDTVDDTHEYDDTSPARCGACGYRDDFAGFHAFPDGITTAGPIWFDWTDAGGNVGSARWGDQPADRINTTLQSLHQYWPGIRATVEGGADGITITVDPAWADNVTTLIDAAIGSMGEVLGAPDTVV